MKIEFDRSPTLIKVIDAVPLVSLAFNVALIFFKIIVIPLLGDETIKNSDILTLFRARTGILCLLKGIPFISWGVSFASAPHAFFAQQMIKNYAPSKRFFAEI